MSPTHLVSLLNLINQISLENGIYIQYYCLERGMLIFYAILLGVIVISVFSYINFISAKYILLGIIYKNW
jgi:hypothetical protein